MAAACSLVGWGLQGTVFLCILQPGSGLYRGLLSTELLKTEQVGQCSVEVPGKTSCKLPKGRAQSQALDKRMLTFASFSATERVPRPWIIMSKSEGRLGHSGGNTDKFPLFMGCWAHVHGK